VVVVGIVVVLVSFSLTSGLTVVVVVEDVVVVLSSSPL
jgi:hypothetical protein